MVGIVGIDHIQLAMPVGGEAAARRFYVGLLGLNEVPKPEPMARRGGCWFEAPGVDVHLGVEADFRPARKAHPAFRVDDLAALAAQLDQSGVAVRGDDEIANAARCFIEDCFGNRIELIQD